MLVKGLRLLLPNDTTQPQPLDKRNAENRDAEFSEGQLMKERGQPCPRGALQTRLKTRGQGCPRSVRQVS